MRILLICKCPPIQGGVSSSALLCIQDLVELGFSVTVLTNSNDVEDGYKQMFGEADHIFFRDTLLNKVEFYSTDRSQNFFHIPFSMAYAERLFGLGITILASKKVDLILGWYFQPYGLVANQLSKEFDIPYAIRHAGSDIGKLSNNHELFPSYQRMLQSAEMIVASKGADKKILKLFGEDLHSKIHLTSKGKKLPDYFNPTTEAIDFDTYIELSKERYLSPFYRPFSEKLIQLNSKEIDYKVPIIGMYGKCGDSKGSWDIINSLILLKQKGVKFQFIYLTGGNGRLLNQYFSFLFRNSEILDSVWVLPFLPFWKVPSFVKICDVVTFLEHDFKVDMHSPSVPLEVLSMAKCLICSQQTISKLGLKGIMNDGISYLSVEDPKNSQLLCNVIARALENKTLSSKIANNGFDVFRSIQRRRLNTHPIAELIKNWQINKTRDLRE